MLAHPEPDSPQHSFHFILAIAGKQALDRLILNVGHALPAFARPFLNGQEQYAAAMRSFMGNAKAPYDR